MQLYKVAESEGRDKTEGLTKRSKEKVTTNYGLSKHLLILPYKWLGLQY